MRCKNFDARADGVGKWNTGAIPIVTKANECTQKPAPTMALLYTWITVDTRRDTRENIYWPQVS
jgi:hypothetical protein